MNHKVLVIDDEADIRATVEILLGRMHLDSWAVESVKAAIAELQNCDYDLVLCDMRLGDGLGLEVVRWINEFKPQIPVAVITAYSSTEDAVEALKAGAFDYVSKPVDLDVLRRIVQDALRTHSTPAAPIEAPQKTLVGESAEIERLREMIEKLARTQAPVFLHGESGTGKELVARQIHATSPRAQAPFVAVNCGAIPSELFESELFGHKKGSFTGATQDNPGLFVSADGGTLFLDEVADLPLIMQVKLLRALQERRIRPVGSTAEVPVDVRIISAAQSELGQAVQAKSFREDLYYRLNVIKLEIPPLRHRHSDIPLLCEHLIGQISARLGLPPPPLANGALQCLQAYPFPGNVRELENILERACALAEPGTTLTVDDIELPNDHLVNDANGTSANFPIDQALANTEKNRILEALEATRWNRTRAAARLGISFRSLRYRLQKLGIERPERPERD